MQVINEARFPTSPNRNDARLFANLFSPDVAHAMRCSSECKVKFLHHIKKIKKKEEKRERLIDGVMNKGRWPISWGEQLQSHLVVEYNNIRH